MAKGKRGKKPKGQKVEVYDSDDERAYKKEAVPDPTSSEFYHDEIDDFHSNREKILLDRGAALEPAGFSSDEQEGVMDIDSDSDDDADIQRFEEDDDDEIQNYKKQIRHFKSQKFKHKMGSDIEDEEEGLPDDKAWGKKRKQFYGADVDADIDVGSDVEASAAALEEKEALAIQQRLAQQLDEGDFGLDIFTAPEPEEQAEGDRKTDQKIEKDLSTLSKKEKLKLLKKESPELLELIDDYKRKMTELHERLVPIQKQIRSAKLPGESSAAHYINTKVRLNLNYCVNITFYIMLKAKKSPVHNHPVITRLLQFRNLLKQLEPADREMAPVMDELLQKIQAGDELVTEPDVTESASRKPKRNKKRKLTETPEKKQKRVSELLDESSSGEEEAADTRKAPKRKKKDFLTDAEKEALQNYEMMKSRKSVKFAPAESGDNEDDDEEEDEAAAADGDQEGKEGEEEDEFGEDGEKRPINYQIAKNKGLTPKKKKENRNPRVKHRRKYKKALIRRKGQVRTVRTETERYGGELSGIRAGRIASRKLKA